MAIIAANTVLITLAAATTCMRLWARSLRKTSLQANDYIICLSWVMVVSAHAIVTDPDSVLSYLILGSLFVSTLVS